MAYHIGVGRPDSYDLPRWNLGQVLFRFGQRFNSVAVRRQTLVWSTPLSAATVAAHFPASVGDDDEDGE